jgi:hypothetical protein
MKHEHSLAAVEKNTSVGFTVNSSLFLILITKIFTIATVLKENVEEELFVFCFQDH